MDSSHSHLNKMADIINTIEMFENTTDIGYIIDLGQMLTFKVELTNLDKTPSITLKETWSLYFNDYYDVIHSITRNDREYELLDYPYINDDNIRYYYENIDGLYDVITIQARKDPSGALCTITGGLYTCSDIYNISEHTSSKIVASYRYHP